MIILDESRCRERTTKVDGFGDAVIDTCDALYRAADPDGTSLVAVDGYDTVGRQPIFLCDERGWSSGSWQVAAYPVQPADPELARLAYLQRGDLTSAEASGDLHLIGDPFRTRVVTQQSAIVRADPHIALVVFAQAADEVGGQQPLLHGDGAHDASSFTVG